ncbi:hypothetical protein [Mesorhizobium sp. M1378]|uniref:hypothetical protein n=1 Tax=Mesorhizobium sp. M1378 TaxID=2957092 RepID=UPI003339353D
MSVRLGWCLVASYLLCWQASAQSFIEKTLPLWPVTHVGDEIPSALIDAWAKQGDLCVVPGTKKGFPSKGTLGKPEHGRPRNPQSAQDSAYNCDDGDMTNYNGMLCAVGDQRGCDAVRNAQDADGRFYRSPHRRWMWAARCYSKENPFDEKRFREQCANGLSPDMNLGILLYVIATRDAGAYDRWLNWLDANAATTELCKLDADNKPYDCQRTLPWPRVCPVDLGYTGNKKPAVSIFGRYGGQCALRPWDALDFTAVDDALMVAPPPRINSFEILSRRLMEKAVTDVSGGHLTKVPVLWYLALGDEAKAFPLHLDAERVLIRMLIENPTLQLNNLPELPDPDDFLSQAPGFGSSDASDPLSINGAAKIIAARDPANPFFRLLAYGPTSEIRDQILRACPPADFVPFRVPEGATSEEIVARQLPPGRSRWLWEVGDAPQLDGYLDNDPRRSMGWDCVFVAKLYNKMRVRKDLADELWAWLRKSADGMGTILNQTSHLLEQADAAVEQAREGFDEKVKQLNEARKLLNGGYEKALSNLNKAVQDISAQIARLPETKAALDRQIPELEKQHTAAEKALEEILCPLGICPDDVKKRIEQAKRLRDSLAGNIKRKNDEVTAIVSGAAAKALQGHLEETQTAIAKLNKTKKELDTGALENARKLAQADLELKARGLAQARQRVAETQQAKRRLEAYLEFWKDDGPPVDKTVSESADQVPAINTQMSLYETADVPQPGGQSLCPVPSDGASDGTSDGISMVLGDGYQDPRDTQYRSLKVSLRSHIDAVLPGEVFANAEALPYAVLTLPDRKQQRYRVIKQDLKGCQEELLHRLVAVSDDGIVKALQYSYSAETYSLSAGGFEPQTTLECGTEVIRRELQSIGFETGAAMSIKGDEWRESLRFSAEGLQVDYSKQIANTGRYTPNGASKIRRCTESLAITAP